MEPFRVHILGCGSALPTLRHFSAMQVVELRGKQMMVDCGEGAQIQLRRHHVRFTRLNQVFISHQHGDHCLGLVGMVYVVPTQFVAEMGAEQLQRPPQPLPQWGRPVDV